ncbi:MAG: methyl-accepting chemotaxis protein [Burkholderiales bacterium]
MRHNDPVTRREYVLEPGTWLVSTTDPQGRILHCNASFIGVSGYDRHELLGQPHNLIRHPDMPEEAFRDLWHTLGRGQPWSGIVKNRRKNGDHYWVQANVTPMMDGASCVGYMSVRTTVQPADIEAAAQLYAALCAQERQGAPLRLRLTEGRVERIGPIGSLQRATRRVGEGRLTFAPLLLGGAAWALGRWGGPMNLGLMLALGLALATALALRRGVERPLARILSFAERIAAGDLTQRMSGERADTMGRVAQALNQMSANLQATIGDARAEVEQMTHALGEIAAGNHDMSVRTESQAASVQETATAMEQLATTVGHNTASARSAATLADETAALSGRGAEAVEHVRATMRSIDDSSQRIADITQVIDTISFQTNILALNAAVEAARAGEQGRGFAVVAGEVRALANRTTEAARQIKRLIEESASTVGAGVEQAGCASELMADSLTSVRRVTECMHDIQRASDEQQLGISQSSQAVAHLDSITQQNAAMVEQLSASATALRARADELRASMAVFSMDGGSRPLLPQAVQLRKAARAAQAS